MQVRLTGRGEYRGDEPSLVDFAPESLVTTGRLANDIAGRVAELSSESKTWDRQQVSRMGKEADE